MSAADLVTEFREAQDDIQSLHEGCRIAQGVDPTRPLRVTQGHLADRQGLDAHPQPKRHEPEPPAA